MFADQLVIPNLQLNSLRVAVARRCVALFNLWLLRVAYTENQNTSLIKF